MFISCTTHYDVLSVQEESQVIQEAEGENESIESIISPYRQQLEEEMNRVLCQNSEHLIKARPESGLGNFVSDLCLVKARELDDKPIDFALFNHGGLRTALPKGDITTGKIFELMPFENELVVVELPKVEVMTILEYLVARGGEPVADLKLISKSGEVTESLIQGKQIEDRNYRVLTSDYLANGGDKMSFFTEGRRISKTSLGMKIRDAIISHCQELGDKGEPINAKTDGRIIIQD
jgi:2',3'-cyclic-nucleotide 2'-phosphodiesterase (5'-nucleotidase family)